MAQDDVILEFERIIEESTKHFEALDAFQAALREKNATSAVDEVEVMLQELEQLVETPVETEEDVDTVINALVSAQESNEAKALEISKNYDLEEELIKLIGDAVEDDFQALDDVIESTKNTEHQDPDKIIDDILAEQEQIVRSQYNEDNMVSDLNAMSASKEEIESILGDVSPVVIKKQTDNITTTTQSEAPAVEAPKEEDPYAAMINDVAQEVKVETQAQAIQVQVAAAQPIAAPTTPSYPVQQAIPTVPAAQKPQGFVDRLISGVKSFFTQDIKPLITSKKPIEPHVSHVDEVKKDPTDPSRNM